MKKHTQLQILKPILSVSVREIMSFGEKLKQWRKAAGMTQQELADASGVNVSYISNLERDFSATTKSGLPKASEHLAERMAKVLSVRVDEMRVNAGHAPTNPRSAFYILSDGLNESAIEEIRAFADFKRTQRSNNRLPDAHPFRNGNVEPHHGLDLNNVPHRGATDTLFTDKTKK